MSAFTRQALVVARRDFTAVVATPTFLLFLLAPLFMILMSLLGVTGAAQIADTSQDKMRIGIIAAPSDGPLLMAADQRMRDLLPNEIQPPKLDLIPEHGADSAAVAQVLLAQPDPNFVAIFYGPLEKPTILKEDGRRSIYLATLAEQALRDRRAGIAPGTLLSKAQTTEKKVLTASASSKHATGYAAVFGIFFLTLLLAGQSVGMLAEEKSNKVIEILAAAAPLEAVFLGKLIGMFGVALLFVGFWAGLAGVAIVLSASFIPLPPIAAAVGLPTFLLLCALYFTMAFMLLGAIFLGVGAQASTMREIQMMSLPITIFQVAMFGLSSAAAGAPDSSLARFAEIFPFSSPFAMAARAANAPEIWPHIAALCWQGLWVAITIWITAGLFRRGVLKSGPGLLSLLRRKR